MNNAGDDRPFDSCVRTDSMVGRTLTLVRYVACECANVSALQSVTLLNAFCNFQPRPSDPTLPPSPSCLCFAARSQELFLSPLLPPLICHMRRLAVPSVRMVSWRRERRRCGRRECDNVQQLIHGCGAHRLRSRVPMHGHFLYLWPVLGTSRTFLPIQNRVLRCTSTAFHPFFIPFTDYVNLSRGVLSCISMCFVISSIHLAGRTRLHLPSVPTRS